MALSHSCCYLFRTDWRTPTARPTEKDKGRLPQRATISKLFLLVLQISPFEKQLKALVTLPIFMLGNAECYWNLSCIEDFQFILSVMMV